MRVSGLSSLGLFAIALALASCAAPAPKRALVPGYYILNESRLGVERRIIVTAGERHVSYDVWRVSRSGDGSVKRAHYDLVAADEVPNSGTFAVTQEGSDCGTISVEPYQGKFGTDDWVLTVRYGLLGIERFVRLQDGDAARYHQYDDAVTRRMLQVSSGKPRLYDRLSLIGKFFYSELNPHCTFD